MVSLFNRITFMEPDPVQNDGSYTAAAGRLCSLRAARADPIRFRSNLVELGIYFDPP